MKRLIPVLLLLACIGCTSDRNDGSSVQTPFVVKNETEPPSAEKTDPRPQTPFVVKNETKLPFSAGDSLELKFSGCQWSGRVPVLKTRGTFFCTHVGGKEERATWVNAATLEQIRVFKKE